jgi:hypothetical protein
VLDGLVYSAEVGSAWTLLYPDYSVIVPKGLNFQVPVAFGLPAGELEFQQFMDSWLTLRLETGVIRDAQEYWIYGEATGSRQPRWSLMGDLLGE